MANARGKNFRTADECHGPRAERGRRSHRVGSRKERCPPRNRPRSLWSRFNCVMRSLIPVALRPPRWLRRACSSRCLKCRQARRLPMRREPSKRALFVRGQRTQRSVLSSLGSPMSPPPPPPPPPSSTRHDGGPTVLLDHHPAAALVVLEGGPIAAGSRSRGSG